MAQDGEKRHGFFCIFLMEGARVMAPNLDSPWLLCFSQGLGFPSLSLHHEMFYLSGSPGCILSLPPKEPN